MCEKLAICFYFLNVLTWQNKRIGNPYVDLQHCGGNLTVQENQNSGLDDLTSTFYLKSQILENFYKYAEGLRHVTEYLGKKSNS